MVAPFSTIGRVCGGAGTSFDASATFAQSTSAPAARMAPDTDARQLNRVRFILIVPAAVLIAAVVVGVVGRLAALFLARRLLVVALLLLVLFRLADFLHPLSQGLL